MHPELIKAQIRMKGISCAVIADELGVTHATVSAVLHGQRTSARVARRIAEVVGLPVATLWPQRRPLMRRAKASKVATTD